MRSSPAAVPALLLVLLCGVTPSMRPVPAWAPLGLVAGAVALGGPAAAPLVGAAAGLWLGETRRRQEPGATRGYVAEAEGRLCGPWREGRELPGRSARLCPDWLRVGGRLVRAAPPLQVDLPESIAPPPIGVAIHVRGTLSRFTGLANADPVPAGPWRLRVKSTAFLRTTARAGLFARLNDAVRSRLDAAIAATGAAGRPGVALVRALVLGDEEGFDESRRRALRRSGLAHLFAVSGFNLTVVAVFVSWLVGAGPRGARLLLPGAAVFAYLAAVGPEPSMLRATVMATLGLAILASGRPRAALQALAIAAIVLVASRPEIVDEVGFRLSFGATGGLILGARFPTEPARRLPAPLGSALAASLAAQLGALPFAVAAFGELSPAAPVANLVAVPWAAVWLLVGMAWLAFAALAPATAGRAAPALDLGAAPFEALDRLPPTPWLSLGLHGGLVAGTLAAAAVALVAVTRRGRAASPLLAIVLLAQGGGGPRLDEAEVTFLDVAQGDAALVRDGRFVALIDGGGLVGRDVGAAVLRPAMARRGVAAIDVAILSHSDRDHCRGLLDLVATTPIRELWSSAGQLDRGCGAGLRERIDGRVRALRAGDVVERGRVRFEVLHPEPAAGGRSSNAESLVVVVELAGRRFLFAGDLDHAGESALAALEGRMLAADVLKVSHHGAAGSTPEPWLDAVRPRWAVVSAGGSNAYGHPAAATIERLRASGARVLRTDRQGEIEFSRRAEGPWRLTLPADAWRRPIDR